MLVLQILGGLIALFIGYVFLSIFNDHCEEKFDYKFFNKVALVVIGISLALGLFGYEWYINSKTDGGDTLNGVVLLALSGIAAAGLIYMNFSKTSIIYGVGGSIIQFGVFGAFLYIGFFVLILGLVASMFLGAASSGDSYPKGPHNL